MKKVLFIIVIVALLIIPLTACSQEPVPGSAWASYEELLYEVTEGTTVIGSLTTTITRITEESFEFESLERTITINDRVTRGTFIEIAYMDLSDNIFLTNQILMDGFNTVASYREQVVDGATYETKILYDDKGVDWFSLKKDGNTINSGDMRIRGSVVDSGAIYTYFRAYNIGIKDFSRTIDVPNPTTGNAETLSFTSLGSEKVNGVPLGGEKLNDLTNIDTIKARITRTSPPVGESIIVYYAQQKDEYRVIAEGSYNSFRIPVKIIENNLTYTLKEIIEVK